VLGSLPAASLWPSDARARQRITRALAVCGVSTPGFGGVLGSLPTTRTLVSGGDLTDGFGGVLGSLPAASLWPS
jgi:hypothetical protein